MSEKVKVSNAEINKVVTAALRKKSRQRPVYDTHEQFWFGDKKYVLKFTRRYHRGQVSLCNPASCNAGEGCCHLRKVNGIDLCYTGSDDFDLLKHRGEHIIIDSIDEEMSGKIFNAVRNVLRLIAETPPEPKENE